MSRYMMATTAYHKMGDISRDEPNLVIIREEPVRYPSEVDGIVGSKEYCGQEELPHGEYYVGNFVEGFGFINVHFPVETTRPLTEEEIQYYERGYYQLADHEPIKMSIRDKT